VIILPDMQEEILQEEAMTQEHPAALPRQLDDGSARIAALEKRMERLSREVEEVRQLYEKTPTHPAPAQQLVPYRMPSLWDKVYQKLRLLIRVMQTFFD
jgi:hypothetical protein